MSRSSLVALAVFAFLAITQTAFAASNLTRPAFLPVDGQYSVKQVNAECDAAGGVRVSGARGEYGCRVDNCDRKNGQCVVACQDTRCTASTPRGRYGRVHYPRLRAALARQ